MICLYSKKYCCYESQSNKLKLNNRGFQKRTLVASGVGPMFKYRKVLEEVVNVTSAYRGSRSTQHAVAKYQEIKKGLSYFCPGRQVQQDGIHFHPLNK